MDGVAAGLGVADGRAGVAVGAELGVGADDGPDGADVGLPPLQPARTSATSTARLRAMLDPGTIRVSLIAAGRAQSIRRSAESR